MGQKTAKRQFFDCGHDGVASGVRCAMMSRTAHARGRGAGGARTLPEETEMNTSTLAPRLIGRKTV
jgi:hypothetical protein